MKPELVVAVLTFLSAVVVVLTRFRLSPAGAAGQAQVGKATVNAHTACGVLALALWVPFLATGHDSSLVGVLGLFFYWLTAVVGLLDPLALEAEPGTARGERDPRRLVPGPRAVDPGPRRHARGCLRVHVVLRDPELMQTLSRERRRGLAAAGLRLALVPAALFLPTATGSRAPSRPAVIGHRVIGHSVRGRPIKAWHLGQPGRRKVVLISTMHGNERGAAADPDRPARRAAGPRPRPLGGPGLQPRRPRPPTPARTPTASTSTATTPTSWSDLDGNYESGPEPAPSPRPGR